MRLLLCRPRWQTRAVVLAARGCASMDDCQPPWRTPSRAQGDQAGLPASDAVSYRASASMARGNSTLFSLWMWMCRSTSSLPISSSMAA